MIQSIAFLLIPIAFVSVILVGLVLLFARDRAVIVLRNMYLYGVMVIMLLVSVGALIGIFNTLLNTVIFPTQSDDDLSYARPVEIMSNFQLAPGVEEYLKTQQATIDKQVDGIAFTQNWRDQLAWIIPLLLVSLPLFMIYRRKILKPFETDTSAAMPGVVIRYAYLFLATYLSLVALVIGSMGIINVVLEQYVLPPSYDLYALRSVLNNEVGSKLVIPPAPTPEAIPAKPLFTMADAQARVAQAMTNLHAQIESAKSSQLPLNTRNRGLSLSLSFLVIGGAIYWWHRRDLMKLKVES